MNNKICIFSSIRDISDVRMFHRETVSLLRAGYKVTLIVPIAESKVFSDNNIKLIPIKPPSNRFRRFLSHFKILTLLIKEDADAYHFYDPDLILIGLILKLLKKRVIYDVLENLGPQTYSKMWIPYILRKPVSVIARFIERIAVLFFDRIIVAGEDIQEQPHFRKFRHKITLIRNFPVITLDREKALSKPKDKVTFIYSGGLTEDRGILEIVRAFKNLKLNNIELIILGKFYSFDFEKK